MYLDILLHVDFGGQQFDFGLGEELHGGNVVVQYLALFSPSLHMVPSLTDAPMGWGWGLVYPRLHCARHCLMDKGGPRCLGLNVGSSPSQTKGEWNKINKLYVQCDVVAITPDSVCCRVKTLDDNYTIMAVENATFGLVGGYVNSVTFSHEGLEGCGHMILCVACIRSFDYHHEGKALCVAGGCIGDYLWSMRFVTVVWRQTLLKGKPLVKRIFLVAKEASMTNPNCVFEQGFANLQFSISHQVVLQ